MRYKVYLDGTLVNEPIGLIDSKLDFKRDEALNGIFTQYVSDLTFYGAGYDYLRGLLDSDECAQVQCEIKVQCSNDQPYETFFLGVIPIGSDDIDWNLQDCTVTTPIKSADFSDFLNEYLDYQVKIQPTGTDAPTCIDNTTVLATITRNTTAFFPGFAGAYTSTGRHSYLVTDVLQQVLSYLSNNNVILDADTMYSTLFVAQVVTVHFDTVNLNPGDVILISWTNYYGQQYSLQDTVSLNFIQRIAGRLLHFIGNTITPQYAARTNFFEKASYTETSGGGQDIDITNYLPWQNYSISVNGAGSPFATITETTPFVYGLKNLALTDTTDMQQQAQDLFVTLRQLLTHLVRFNNVGFRLVKSGANYNFQIRKTETLLDDTSTAVDIINVPNVTFKTSGLYAITNLTTPDGKADNIFKKVTYNTAYCLGDNFKIEGKDYSSQEIFDILNATVEQKQDDRLFFFFLKEGDYTRVAQYKFNMCDDPNTPPSTDTYFHYNIPYIHGLIATRYNINIAGKTFKTTINRSFFDNIALCANCPAAEIPNDTPASKHLKRLYSFSYPLTYSQVRELLTKSLNYVTFEDSNGVIRNGFIKQVTIPFGSFVAEFDVYSQ